MPLERSCDMSAYLNHRSKALRGIEHIQVRLLVRDAASTDDCLRECENRVDILRELTNVGTREHE